MEATKLTLSLDKEVIDKAKEIAKKRGMSLSKYIQKFLEKSIQNENLQDEIKGNIPNDIRKLRGILKGQDISKEQLQDMKYEYLKNKYDL
ncbi:MAG TPA: DUF6364 family protein [Sphingobacteriaceae bacterium]